MLHASITADRRLVPDDAPLELAVVIPLDHAAGTLPALLRALDAALAPAVWEAILVDLDPRDRSAARLREFGRRNIRVRVVASIGRRDRSACVIAGMSATCAPVLALIDADMEEDVRLLPRLFAAVRHGGCDLAVGSNGIAGRGIAEWEFERSAGRRGLGALVGRLTGTPLSDPASGCFAMTREAFARALPRLSGTGAAILLDLAVSAPRAMRLVELPRPAGSRTADRTRHELALGFEYLRLVLDKAVGRFVPVRLVPFLVVGLLGLAVHLGVSATLSALGFLSTWAGGIALWSGMSAAFLLNNLATFRDRRLRGWRLFPGLASFYAACLAGIVAQRGVGGAHETGWIGGLAAAAVGLVWTFAVAGAVTWRGGRDPRL